MKLIRLARSHNVYSTAERQLQECRVRSNEMKLNDMLQLGRGWKIWTRMFSSRANRYTGLQDDKEFNPVELAFEVHDVINKFGIDCVIGGSMGLFTLTQPRMTKDVDLNINTSDHQRLISIFGSDRLTPMQRLYGKNVLPDFRNEFVSVTTLTYKDINIDLFLNTCRATNRVHQTSTMIMDKKFISLENLAFFKLFSVDKLSKRYYKDLDDLTLIALSPNVDHKLIELYIIETFGDNSLQLQTWRDIIARLQI